MKGMRFGTKALVVVGAQLGLLVAAAPAAADVTCTYDPVSRTATASATGVLNDGRQDGVYRDGDQIAVSDGGPCGVATVFNTDTIIVRDVSASGSLGRNSPDIASTFAPGFTDEPGSSDEIEIVLDYGAGEDGLLMFPARTPAVPGPHFVTVGRRLMNLNAAEPDGIDADVTLNGVDFITIFLNAVYGGSEADEIRGDGGDGTGAEPASAQLNFIGGPGEDLLVGGNGEDLFAGEEGADRVLGGEGRDEAYGGPGADRLLGERGRDILRGEAGNDHHSGGPGRDYCDGGPGRDAFASCERTRG